MLLFRFRITKDKKRIRSNESLVDTVWLWANNPDTAKIRVIRWYDQYIGKRDVDDPSAIKSDLLSPYSTIPKNGLQVYSWNVWYNLKDCDQCLGAPSFGRTREEAAFMARKFFPLPVSPSRIKGIKRIDRMVLDNETISK